MIWDGTAPFLDGETGGGRKITKRANGIVSELPYSVPPPSQIKCKPTIRAQDKSSFAPEIAPSLPLDHPGDLVTGCTPVYRTGVGAAYASDSLVLMQSIPAGSVSSVITSPPYALEFKKEYGNANKADYVTWMLPFAEQIKRILTPDGSFILNIGGSYNAGEPTRSLYHFKLLIALCEEIGFHLAQECFWFNPAKLPAPAEWVNVKRFRIKDSVEYVWWLSPSPRPYADNKQVLGPYSPDMKRLIEKGYKAKLRPSGHNITKKFQKKTWVVQSPQTF